MNARPRRKPAAGDPLLARMGAAPEADVDAPHLVAVSGGRDSVALLHLLLASGYRCLIVCHLDHALRAESAAEARFVAQLAERASIPFFSRRIQVASLAQRDALSIETAARIARHRFFAAAARKFATPRVFLAHHADDQAETFLLKLFRGAGARGLGAMRRVQELRIGSTTLTLHRPLLDVWRSEIDAYIARHQLAYCEDSSNADPDPQRNRLRLELLPLLQQHFGRSLPRILHRTAATLRDEDDLLRSLIPKPAPQLSVPELKALHPALQRRTLRAWLEQAQIPNISFDLIESVRSLLSSSTAKVNLPGGSHARRRSKLLFLQHPALTPQAAAPLPRTKTGKRSHASGTVTRGEP